MTDATEHEINLETGKVIVVNDSDVATDAVMSQLRRDYPEVAAIERWQRQSRRRQGLFQRDQYVIPDNIFDKMKTAYKAVSQDDVVSGVAETTEQLAFKRVGLECDSEEEESVWQQLGNQLDLPNFMRQVWREIFTVSQAYVAVVYGKKDFKVDGMTPNGNRRKKTYSGLEVPISLTLLDPLRVIPVGSFMFGNDRLAYIANEAEIEKFDDNIVNGTDDVMNQLIVSKYEPSDEEAKELNDLVGQSVRSRLYLLNPDRVFRITATRPDYQRFAHVRMESVFELLDLKHQLREMDRSALIGATNAIILVKKGSDSLPAKRGEVEALAAQVKTTSRMPIIVGDHRIDVEIITPKTDKTLAAERYNALDSRITSRLYQILSTGNYASGTATDDSLKLLRVVAASMEARRDVIRDNLVDKIFLPTWEKNDQLEDKPEMQFYPRRIALDFDPNIARFMQELRDRGDISRETILAELDIIERTEAVKREREAIYYDHIFTQTNVPFSASPNGQDGDNDGPDFRNDPRMAGPRNGPKGGRPPGTPRNDDENPGGSS